jgi:hypothetical protein
MISNCQLTNINQVQKESKSRGKKEKKRKEKNLMSEEFTNHQIANVFILHWHHPIITQWTPPRSRPRSPP